jgi:hypothetical protein
MISPCFMSQLRLDFVPRGKKGKKKMKLRAGMKMLNPCVALVALSLLMGQGLDNGSPSLSPSADEPTPAVNTIPPAVNPEVPSATAPVPENRAVVVPATTPPPASAKKDKKEKAAKTEVLPWANAPKVPVSTDPAGNPADAVAAATMAQCAGLFEAVCRETATCAWVADIKQEDGSTIASHCVGRGTAPPKKGATAKAKPKPKPEAAAVAAAPATAAKPLTISPPGAAPPIVVTAPPAAQ